MHYLTNIGLILKKQLKSQKMKILIRTLSLLLITLGLTDFILAEFFDIYTTDVFSYSGDISNGDLKITYWSPYILVVLGLVFYYINIHFLKPKNINITADSITKSVTRYQGISKEDGKLYVTSEKITFDGADTIEINYEQITSVLKTRVLLFFPAIKINTVNEKYLFGFLYGREKLFNTINKFNKNNKI